MPKPIFLKRDRAAGLVIKGDKVLLIERTKLNDRYFSVPGGGIDEGEEPAQAAVREVFEETSIRAKYRQLLYVAETAVGKQYFYLCDYISGKPELHPDSSEAKVNFKGINHYRPKWVPIKKLAKTEMRPAEVKEHFLTDLEEGFGSKAREIDVEWRSHQNLRQLKKLGQHWLFDRPSLQKIVKAAELTPDDTVLEVGPGLGSLTRYLAHQASQVIAIEKDERFIKYLQTHFHNDNVAFVNEDILRFDLGTLPKGYKVVANIPYYLTSELIRLLLESANSPKLIALLVQKEVAQRITAEPGQMSVLAFSVQYYGEVKVMGTVPRELFQPVPKVDSAIIQIKRRPQAYFEADTKKLFQLVKAGFSQRRKQLKNSLAGGLHIKVPEAARLIKQAGLAETARAQELSMDQWHELYKVIAL